MGTPLRMGPYELGVSEHNFISGVFRHDDNYRGHHVERSEDMF